MTTIIKFTYPSTFEGYKCNLPGDQSGEYVSLTEHKDLIAEVERLRATNAKLVEVIKPFARAADYWDQLSRARQSFSSEDVIPLQMEPYRMARVALLLARAT